MKVAEIFAELGFKIKDENLGEFVNSLSKLNVATVASAAGLGGVYLALEKITTQAVEAAHALANFNAQTGMSSVELQKWAQLGERVGITAEDVKSSFSGLQQAITAINFGGGNTAPFSFFGIDPRAFSTDAAGMRKAMMEIGKVLKEADPATRRYWASQMGLSDAMIQLLVSTKLTNEELEKQITMLDPARDSLNGLRAAAVQFSQEIKGIGNSIGAALSPALTGLFQIANAFLELYRNSETFRMVMITILAIFGFLIATLMGPLTAIGLAIAFWGAALGEVVFYWNEIKEAINDAYQAAMKFYNSPMGKLLTGNLAGAAQSVFLPNDQGSQNSTNVDARQDNHLTVHVDAKSGSNGIVESIEDAWERLVGRTAYQRKLKST